MLKKKLKSVSLALVVILVIATALSGCQSQQSSDSQTPGTSTDNTASKTSFPEKNITIIVPYSPGGSYDTYARMLAPYLQKYLPNKPNVIIENVDGGGGITGSSKLYNSAPDGYTIGLLNIPGFVVNQILGMSDFDLGNFSYIGTAGNTTYIGAVSPKSPYKSMKDLIAADKVKVGSVGLSSAAGLGTLLASQRIGMKAELIPNTGATEAVMSAVRGDTAYVQDSYATLAQYLDAKQLIPVVVFSKERLKAYPDVPTIAELGYPDLLEVVTQCRPLAAPPGVPDDVLAVLRDAFASAMNDPEFQQMTSTQMHEEVNMINGDDTLQLVKDTVQQFTQYKDIIEANSK